MQSGGRESVADVALRGGLMEATQSPSRAKVLGRLRLGDKTFHLLTRAAALAVLGILGGVIFSLAVGAWPALQAFGFNFLIEERWNPVTERFGALAPIYGTLITSFIAMLIAVPIGPDRHIPDRAVPASPAPPDRHRDRAPGRHSQHHLWHLGPVHLRAVPAGDVAAVPHHGIRQCPGPVGAVRRPALRHRHADGRPDPRHHGAPFVTSISRDVFDAVPPVLKEAAYGMGCTTWEVVRYVVIPIRASGSSAASCSGSGVRWARPWR